MAEERSQTELKRLSCIIKPFRMEAVLRAIRPLDPQGLTISEVRGYGRQKGHLELYSGSEYSISFIPKVKIEFAVDGARAEEAVGAVVRAARTGRIGDGKIFIRRADATPIG